VEEIDAEGLAAGTERIETTNILWCAGTAARPAAEWLGAEAARNGAVKVGGDCSVPGHPNIFALGDVSSLEGGDGRPLAGLAPVAKQQGAYVGRLLKARIAGRPDPAPFRYHDFGTMAVIGRSRAVADFGWCQLTGFPAWLTWSLVHLMLLVDFRSRLMVYVNWSWAWFTSGRGARLVTREVDSVEATPLGRARGHDGVARVRSDAETRRPLGGIGFGRHTDGNDLHQSRTYAGGGARASAEDAE